MSASGFLLRRSVPALLGLLLAPAATAQPLWQPVSGKTGAECALESGPALRPVACVLPDFDAVRRLVGRDAGTQVSPRSSRFPYRVDRAEQRPGGGSVAAARVSSARERFQLTLDGDRLTAWLQEEGTTWEVRPGAGGMHVLYRIDDAAVTVLEPPQPQSTGLLFGEGTEAPEGSDAVLEASSGSEPSAYEITVLVAYTTLVKTRLGTSGLASRVQSLQDWLNQAFVNGGHPEITVRVVGTVETVYTPASSMATDVERLLNPSDGYLDDLHPQRVSAGADLLHLLVADQSDACGIAYVPHDLRPDLGVGVSAASCPLSTFAHEIGHNFGMGHDTYVSTTDAWWSWGYGYVDPDYRFRTIMAYANQCSAAGRTCPEIQYFSDPDRTYQGYPLGIPFAEGTRSADNVRVLEDMVANVADNSRYLHPACDWTPRSISVSPSTLSATTVATFRATLEAGPAGCTLERVRLEFAPAGAGSSSPTYPAGTHEISASPGQQIQLSSSFTVTSAGLPAGSFQPRVLIVRRGYYWYINNNTTVTSGVGVEGQDTLLLKEGLGAPWPNPARDRVTVRLQGVHRLLVFDVLGRVVQEIPAETAQAGPTELSFDTTRLAPGVYFLRATGSPATRTLLVAR